MKSNWLWDTKITEVNAKSILKNPEHKEFVRLAALLLARTNEPKDVFAQYLTAHLFCEYWPAIKRKMREDKWTDQRIIFWQAIFEKVREKFLKKGITFKRGQIVPRSTLCKEVGKKIALARKEQHLSQKTLAKKINISQQLISRTERGQENVSLLTLNTIVQALGRHVDINFI